MRALLLIALAVPALASQEKVFPLPLFKDGLYTRYSANAIPGGALSDALNVVLDEDVDGVVVARNGYSKYNTSAITDSQTVRGLWAFDASDGTKYMVAFSSQSFYYTIGDGLWTAITGLNGFSATKDFDCVQTIGYFFCGNGDVVFSWDGTSTSTVSGAPLGNLLGKFRNRLLIAGISGSKARLRGSGELDATDWTLQIPGVSTTPINIAFGGADDGQDITCLMGAFQDVFLVGKRRSLWGLYGFGRTDFQVREISREVGCIEQHSVREKNNCLYWMSERGIEKFCGAVIERVGDPIRDNIDVIIAAAGNSRSATDTSQADFQAGNLSASGAGAPMSATISPGNVVPSTSAVNLQSESDFLAGSFSSAAYYSSGISLSSMVFQDDFSDGDFTSSPTWSYSGDVVPTITSGQLRVTGTGGSQRTTIYSAPVQVSSTTDQSASWSYLAIISKNLASNVDHIFHFMSSSTDFSTNSGYNITWAESGAGGHEVYLYKRSAGVNTLLSSATISGLTQHSVTVSRSSAGVFSVTGFGVDLGATDTTYSFEPYIMIEAITAASGDTIGTDDIYYLQRPSSGTFTSPIFDTTFSTPTPGSLTVSSSVPDGTTIGYSVRSSTSPNNDLWTAWAAATPDTLLSLNQRYQQFSTTFTASTASTIPYVASISLNAATTGYFISQCRNPGTGITSWGIFNCSNETAGGSFSFAISTGSSCDSVTRATATWNAQTNNTVISIDTAAYVAYRVLFDMDAASDTPKIRDCSINWNEGSSRPPVAAQVYRDRYYLAYTSSTATDSHNDHLLVLDKNDKWTLFDNHPCYSMSVYGRKLYCGSSTSAGQVWLLDNGTDDDGAAITSRIRTKAFNLGIPESRKKFRRLYLDLEPSPDPTQTITLTGRYTLERSTPVYSLGTVDLNEDPGSIMTSKFPFVLTNPVAGRYLQLEIESSALNSPWRLFGGRLYYYPLNPE